MKHLIITVFSEWTKKIYSHNVDCHFLCPCFSIIINAFGRQGANICQHSSTAFGLPGKVMMRLPLIKPPPMRESHAVLVKALLSRRSHSPSPSRGQSKSR